MSLALTAIGARSRFETNEVTAPDVAVSPDGQWLVARTAEAVRAHRAQHSGDTNRYRAVGGE